MKGDSDIMTLKRATYRHIHEEWRIAQALLAAEIKHNKGTTAWAHRAFDEQRRLAARCEFLYGAAIAAGAHPDDLKGTT